MRPADIENDHALQLGELNHLESIRCPNLPRAGGWFAPRVRRIAVVPGSPVFEQGFRPGLKGDLLDLAVVRKGVRRGGVNHQFAARPNPMALLAGNSRDVHPSIRPARGRLGALRAFTLTKGRAGEQRERQARPRHRGDEEVSHLRTPICSAGSTFQNTSCTPLRASNDPGDRPGDPCCSPYTSIPSAPRPASSAPRSSSSRSAGYRSWCPRS